MAGSARSLEFDNGGFVNMDFGLAANQVGCCRLGFKVSISGTPEIDTIRNDGE